MAAKFGRAFEHVKIQIAWRFLYSGCGQPNTRIRVPKAGQRRTLPVLMAVQVTGVHTLAEIRYWRVCLIPVPSVVAGQGSVVSL